MALCRGHHSQPTKVPTPLQYRESTAHAVKLWQSAVCMGEGGEEEGVVRGESCYGEELETNTLHLHIGKLLQP